MTEPEASLITDEHRASIGRKTPPVAISISEADAHRMRDVLQDHDPRYADSTGVAAPYVISALDPGLPAGLLPRILPGTLLTQAEWVRRVPPCAGHSTTAPGSSRYRWPAPG